MHIRFLLPLMVLYCLTALQCRAAECSVETWNVPAGGIQPRVITDKAGVTHLVFFKGDPAAGDLFYCRISKSVTTHAVQVNSVPKSACAMGTIRGAQISSDGNGRIFVVWNLVSKGRPMGVAFARMNDSATGFEPQRDLLRSDVIIDGGCSVAADVGPNVYVFWHAVSPGGSETEGKVYLTTSRDFGKTFDEPRAITGGGTCACCGMKASLGSNGEIYVLYRAASTLYERPAALLVSRDAGKSFERSEVSSYRTNSCPMSAFEITHGAGGTVAAWETAAGAKASLIGKWQQSFPNGRAQKYPVVASNKNGQLLAAWVEGAGWNKPGRIKFAKLSSSGKFEEAQDGGQSAVWSFPAVTSLSNGNFVLLR